jgi:methyl-accepting chemotaxis protein
VDKVEQGSQLVDKAGQTMEDIMLSVKKVADIMHEIAQASQEQRGGIEQISLAVSDMDEMTQQNAALVEKRRQQLKYA